MKGSLGYFLLNYLRFAHARIDGQEEGKSWEPQVLQQASPCLGRLSCCFSSCFEVVLSKGEAGGGEPIPAPVLLGNDER